MKDGVELFKSKEKTQALKVLETVNQKVQSGSRCLQPRMVLVGSLPSELPAVGAFSKFVLAGHEASELLSSCSLQLETCWGAISSPDLAGLLAWSLALLRAQAE